MWNPIAESELTEEIRKTESLLTGELLNFWNLIQIPREKWQEKGYGKEGGGFWVVAICGTRVIWYNDIEDGFNISTYATYWEIGEYWCDQHELNEAVMQLYKLVKEGNNTVQSRSAPSSINSKVQPSGGGE